MADGPTVATGSASRRNTVVNLLFPNPLVIKKAKTTKTKDTFISQTEKSKENTGVKTKSTRKVSDVLESNSALSATVEG